jgi:hypothetical protein
MTGTYRESRVPTHYLTQEGGESTGDLLAVSTDEVTLPTPDLTRPKVPCHSSNLHTRASAVAMYRGTLPLS